MTGGHDLKNENGRADAKGFKASTIVIGVGLAIQTISLDEEKYMVEFKGGQG